MPLFFMGVFAIDRLCGLWQPLRYSPLWGLIVIRRLIMAAGGLMIKKLAIGMAAVFGTLLVLGIAIEANKSPEQRAAEAERARQYAAERQAVEREEQAYADLQKVVKPARDVLELAYIQHVKDAEASHVSCQEAEFNKRFFVRCGVAYWGPETANNGLWEAAESNGALVIYAMNGKALRALDKIGAGKEFQSGVGRPSVDTVALSERFQP